MIDDEPRPVWMSPLITHSGVMARFPTLFPIRNPCRRGALPYLPAEPDWPAKQSGRQENNKY
jgi:hypothetical protein